MCLQLIPGSLRSVKAWKVSQDGMQRWMMPRKGGQRNCTRHLVLLTGALVFLISAFMALQKLKKTGSPLHEAAGGLKGDQTMCKGIRLFCREHNSEVSSRGRRKTPLGSTCHFSLLFQVSRAPARAFQSGLFCLFDVLDQRERPAEEVPTSTGRP